MAESKEQHVQWVSKKSVLSLLPLLEPQSRSGDKPVKFQVVLSPNRTAVLKGLSRGSEKLVLDAQRGGDDF